MADQNNNNSQKYNDLGNEIKKSVMDAIESGDFTGLSNGISRSINAALGTVLGEVGDSINRAASQGLSSASQTAKRYHEEQEARIRRNKALRAQAIKRPNKNIKFNDHGGVISVFQMLIGCNFAFIGLIGVLAFATTEFELGGFLVALAFCAIGATAITRGLDKRKVLSTARKLKELVKEKFYVSIEDVSAATGYDRRKTIKEIKKVLSRNFFPEGFLDEDETTFMASREVYDQYLATKKHSIETAKEELKKQGVTNAEETFDNEQLSELGEMMSEGSKAIARLHELNDEIPGEAISAKLYKTESLLQDIFARVKDHPEQMKNCHKLMDYYLPTMLKLVEAYAEYDKIAQPGPDMIKAKTEIEKTIDTINEAFAELLNKLFRDSVWDVTADARVLQSMLGQDGLAKDEYDTDEDELTATASNEEPGLSVGKR